METWSGKLVSIHWTLPSPCASMQVRPDFSDSAKWLGDEIEDGFRRPAHSLIASESESPERKEIES